MDKRHKIIISSAGWFFLFSWLVTPFFAIIPTWFMYKWMVKRCKDD